MDNQGNLYTDDQEVVLSAKARRQLMRVDGTNLTPRAIKRMKVGRNDPCPCGSGKKFKRCHLGFVNP